MRSRPAGLLLLLGLGCGGEGGGAPVADAAAAPAPKEEPPMKVLSPPHGARVTVDEIPLAIWTPRDWRKRPVTLTLDGAPLVDPLALHRDRWSRGGGADYLSTLDLSGLKPGEHELVMSVPKAGKTPAGEIRSRFTYDPAPNLLTLRIEDGKGALRPGRVLIFDALTRGPVAVWGPGAVNDPSGREAAANTVLLEDGEGRLRLPSGRYYLIAAAGIRDAVDARPVEVKGDQTLTFQVPVVVPTPGLLTADLHVHTGRSTDAWLPDRYRFGAVVAADIDVIVVSDHNKVTVPTEALGLLELEQALTVVPGVEAKVARASANAKAPVEEEEEEEEDGEEEEAEPNQKRSGSLAHINTFPLIAGEGAPLPPKATSSLSAMISQWRSRQVEHPYPGSGDRLLIQLNHPRGIQFNPDKKMARVHDLFGKMDLRSGLPLSDQAASWMTAGDGPGIAGFDAMEVMNRFSARAWWEVRADWFNLLNQGIAITATGNADSHSVHIEQVGFPVNLVSMPEGSFDIGAFVDAIAGGRMGVSNGPIVDLRVIGATTGGPGALIAPKGGQVEVEVTVRAAPWVPVPELRLIVDGQPAARLVLAPDLAPNADQPLRIDRGTHRFALPVNQDSWIIAEAGWPIADWRGSVGGLYSILSPGSVPVGFTNPVFLDANGDGQWTRTTPKARVISSTPASPGPATPP